MTRNDEQVNRELIDLRRVLVHGVEVPLGMVARLQASVLRESRARAAIGWEERVAIACVFFIMLGLWSSEAITFPLAVLLGVIAIVYPSAARGRVG